MEDSSDECWFIGDTLEDYLTHHLFLNSDTEENNNNEANTRGDRYRTQPREDERRNNNNFIGSSQAVGPERIENRQRLRAIRRTIAEKAWTPEGSKFLQKELIKCDEHRDFIFEAVFEHMFEFMVHQFGNFVFSRLVERSEERQLRSIVEKLTVDSKQFVKIARNKFGGFAVQRLIRVLKKSPLVSAITSLVAREFKQLMSNRVSSFVMRACFECLDAVQNEELFKIAVSNCIALATNEKSSLALNTSMKYFKQPHKNDLLQIISSQARFLSLNPSGNYAVQEALGLCDRHFTLEICNQLKGDFVRFSTIKWSSHVVKKCMLSEEGLNMVLQEFSNCDMLWKVACDQFGNYVIQYALDMAKGSPYYEAFFEKLYKDIARIQQSGYGVNVYNKLVIHKHSLITTLGSDSEEACRYFFHLVGEY